MSTSRMTLNLKYVNKGGDAQKGHAVIKEENKGGRDGAKSRELLLAPPS